MGKIHYSVEDDKLSIDFEDSNRTVFLRGQTEGKEFHIKNEDFELFPGLSDSDRKDIRAVLKNSNVVFD